jgi:exopolysaccharide biosynthesis polyprenyl glycosylphosphotransferase
MAADVLTVFGVAIAVTLYKFHLAPLVGARSFWRGILMHDRATGLLLVALCGFTAMLILISRRLHLYTPARLASSLNEQRLSVQASLSAGLLLAGALYLVHADDVPRAIVISIIGLVVVLLGLRRLVYRFVLYRRFERGLDTRNILIVGTGAEAVALRYHVDRIRHLGFTFKGFIKLPDANPCQAVDATEIVGTLDTLFQQARKQFVDEIFFTTPCERGIVQRVLEQARIRGVDLRVVPDMYDGFAWDSPIEYIGQFPTIPLHRGRTHELGLMLKRVFDIVFASVTLILLAPLFLAIAIAIKLDSAGPVFYAAERIGKKGIVFHCLKFRTMVRDADQRRAELMSMNERDDVLFKVVDDPRITHLGRFLRKYSLDELPQFVNVLRGEMSVVGPRPPLGGEVRKYNLSHLRRLDVTPGITGLWQVQGRQDPSFASYVSLDVAYIEHWSIWLDIKIVLRTIGVVFAGTGI